MADSMRNQLRHILGVGFGVAVIVGASLGIGILRTPGLVAAQLPGPSAILAVWIVGGLYTLLGSACLTELGTMLPQAGGYYVYARRAFGDQVGFAVGWTDWLTYCAVLGYVSIGMAEFIGVLVPPLAHAVTPIASGILVAFVALQWAGLHFSSRFQELTTALKFAAFLALVIGALLMSGSVHSSPVDAAAASPSLSGVIVALQSVVITYGGWQSALYFSEEDRDPSRNLPRSMIGGVLLVIAIYVLVNLALVVLLPLGTLSRSTLAAADAAAVLLGARGAQMITLLSLVSLPPMLNAIMMIGTRIVFAMGRDGLFWRRTAEVNERGTPSTATLLTTAVALVLILSGTFQWLVAIASIFLAANYCVCCLALFSLRRTAPSLARPFRAWAYPWSAAIVLAGAVAFLAGVFVGDRVNGAAAVVLLVVGLAARAVAARSGAGQPIEGGV